MRNVVIVSCVLWTLGGCVFEKVCVNGAARDASGMCVAMGAVRDSGADAGLDGGGTDANIDGMTSDTDGGTDDGGTDGGGRGRITQFSVGVAHVCAVDSLGTLRCWGSNLFGQLASGDIMAIAAPRVIDLSGPVSSVTGSALGVCAQTSAPALFCWGQENEGQVGDGALSDIPVTTPFEHKGLSARHVASGATNTCVTNPLGTLVCWGRNDRGQLGLGTTGSPQPAPGALMRYDGMMPVENVAATAIGDRHVCMRTNDNRVACVGSNETGELGLGDRTSRNYAEQVPGMTAVTSLSAAASHVCIVNGGDVYCWGDNDEGQAGAVIGVFDSPTLVAGTSGAIAVATGDIATCALLNMRKVVCWGKRTRGGIGDGTPVSDMIVSVPVTVPELVDVVAIGSSFLDVFCALTGSGELYCWGEDATSRLGPPDPLAATVFLDGMQLHTGPVRVNPLP